jgi:hypothetical protein
MSTRFRSFRSRSLGAKRIAAVGVGAALAVSIAALPAQAADTGGLQKAQKAATDRINARLDTLSRLQTAVAGYKDLSTSDRGTLSGLLSSDISGLTALRTKVAGETTAKAVHDDEVSMVDDYRVYLLVVPKVHLTHALDAEALAAARLHKIHDGLADALAKKTAQDTQANKDLLTDMGNQLAAADKAIDGQVSTLLAIKPGPDDKGIVDAVHKVHDSAKDARGDFGRAIADAKKLRAALK